MSPQLLQKAKTLGQLMAESGMPDRLKQAVLNNVQYLTEGQVDALIGSLKEEGESVDKLQDAVSALENFYNQSLTEFEMSQQAVADEFIEEELKNLDKEEKIDQLKSDITNNDW